MTTLAVSLALTSAGLAVFRRERLFGGTLNYWDEVAAFLSIGIAAQWVP